MKNKNSFGDAAQLVFLIIGIALTLGGTIWGSVAMWLREWDHPIGRSEKFHIWFHLWFSPGISIIIGLLIFLYFKIKGFK